MCRRNFSAQALHLDIQSLLAMGAGHGLISLCTAILNDGENFHVLASLRLRIRIDDRTYHLSPLDPRIPLPLRTAAAGIALRLLETHCIAAVCEEVDAECMIFPQSGTYAVQFFRGCTIISADDPEAHLFSNQVDIVEEPGSVAVRAPIWTVVLNDSTSKHDLLATSRQALSSMEVWIDESGLRTCGADTWTPSITFGVPDLADIVECHADCLEKEAS